MSNTSAFELFWVDKLLQCAYTQLRKKHLVERNWKRLNSSLEKAVRYILLLYRNQVGNGGILILNIHGKLPPKWYWNNIFSKIADSCWTCFTQFWNQNTVFHNGVLGSLLVSMNLVLSILMLPKSSKFGKLTWIHKYISKKKRFLFG